MALLLVASIELEFEPRYFGVRALDGGSWGVEGSNQVVVFDPDLSVVMHAAVELAIEEEAESGSLASVDDSGSRAVVAVWPRIVVLGWSSGAVHEVREFQVPIGDSSFGTTAVFDGDDHVVFAARSDASSDDYHLARGCISTGAVEPIGQLPTRGMFEVYDRPSIEGFVVSADDGQHGTAVAVVGRSGDVRLIANDGRFFGGLSRDGQFCVEDGPEIVVRTWPGMSEVVRLHRAALGQPDVQSPWWFAGFSSEGEILAWSVSERTLTVVDPHNAESPQLMELPADSSGTILGVAGRDGRLVIATTKQAYLFAQQATV